MYSYCKINSVADLVITFTVTGDFALTPVAERFYSTFHAAKCRTFQNFPSLGLLSFWFLFLSLFFFFYCCLFVFSGPSILLPLFFFVFFFRVASLFIDNNNVHFTVWFWDSQERCGGRTQPAAPPGVPLYLCVRDACDIAVDEIIKKVNAYSRCRKSVKFRFHHFFCAQKNIIKLLSNVLVLENT